MNRRIGAGAALGGVLVILITVLAAVGASAGAKSSASGTPIRLMTIGPTNAPFFSLPSLPVGAQVAIDAINKAGGLNGHPLQLIVCNDKNDPNTATTCARQAIQQKVAAIVGGLSGSDGTISPILAKAGIPWIGESTSQAYTERNMFLIGNEGVPGYVAVGLSLTKEGCKKIATVISAQGLPNGAALVAAGVAAGGGGAKVVGSYKAPANSADWAPIVSTLRSAGADCVAAITGPPESAGLIGALNAGKKLKIAMLEGGLPDVLIKQLGASANGIYALAGYLPFGAKSRVLQSLAAKAKAKAPKVPLDTFTESGYASVEVLAHAAKGLKQVTSATLSRALPKVKGFDTGLGPVVTLTKPGRVSAVYPRLFNPNFYIWVVKNGNTSLAQPNPIDMSRGLRLVKH